MADTPPRRQRTTRVNMGELVYPQANQAPDPANQGQADPNPNPANQEQPVIRSKRKPSVPWNDYELDVPAEHLDDELDGTVIKTIQGKLSDEYTKKQVPFIERTAGGIERKIQDLNNMPKPIRNLLVKLKEENVELKAKDEQNQVVLAQETNGLKNQLQERDAEIVSLKEMLQQREVSNVALKEKGESSKTKISLSKDELEALTKTIFEVIDDNEHKYRAARAKTHDDTKKAVADAVKNALSTKET